MHLLLFITSQGDTLYASFGCLYLGARHCIGLNVQYTGYWYREWISIFLFGCVSYSKLVLDIEVECCLDGKRDELHSYEILIIQPLLFIVKMYATVTTIFVLATQT
jgi:hypothetical protein